MPVLGLVLFLILICAIEYVCNWLWPGLITAEAHRLIWIVISVIVIVVLVVWALGMFGVNLGNSMNWGPRIGPRD